MMLLLDIAGILLALVGLVVGSKFQWLNARPKSKAEARAKVPNEDKDKAPHPQEKFDLSNTQPYRDVKIKGAAKYRIRMDVHRMDRHNWLTVDKNYMEQYRIREEFLRTQQPMMVQSLPQAGEACEEALQEVAAFLCHRYPSMFEMDKSATRKIVRNKETGDMFPIENFSEEESPLEMASRLTMEDLTILLPDDDGEHYIAATASYFQIGWRADGVIGDTVSKMHEPVPGWQPQIGHAVNKFLTRLTPASPMERPSYFIQVTHADEPMPSVLFQPNGVVHKNLHPRPEHIIVRKERQGFSKLPKTGTILFTVKTSLTPVPELPLDELENLVTEMLSWPEDTARYKGRDHWGDAVMEFWRERKQQIQKESNSTAPSLTGKLNQNASVVEQPWRTHFCQV